MSALRGKAEVEGGAALAALRHRDIDAPDLTLGADLHRLLVAGGPQRHAGGKSRSLDEHLDLATARRALQIAENIPARFAPVAGDAVTQARNVGTQVEFVAVAGATESLLQTQSGAVDIVAGLASDALGCSVGKRDCAVAGPRSVKTGNGPDWAWLTDTDNVSAAPTPVAVIACPNKLEPNNFISNFPIQMTFLYEPRFPRYLQPKPIIVVRRTSITACHGRAAPCTRIRHLFTCRSQYHMHLF